MSAVDMGAFIAPKSDQLNADDLIAGPRTITITGVRANEDSAEQPISISFDGDNRKPYMPCKSMRRVMVYVWGADASAYIGRSMTVYCDPNVQFGGMKVGGIRISHMSHIDSPQTMPLTTTRSKRAPFTVQPLLQRAATATNKPGAAATSTDAPSSYPTVADYAACPDAATLAQLEQRRQQHWKKVPTDDKPRLKEAADSAAARLKPAPASTTKADPGPISGSLPLGFDEAATLLEMRAAKTLAKLESVMAAVRIQFPNASDIPLSVEGTYDEMKERLAVRGEGE